jgi:hypothetical protein
VRAVGPVLGTVLGVGPWAADDGDVDPTLFLGEDLLEWMLLALGGALFVGNVLAVVRPPSDRGDGELERAPVGRSLLFAALGAAAALWALASLVSG